MLAYFLYCALLQATVTAERQRLDELVFVLDAPDQQLYRQLTAEAHQLGAQLHTVQAADSAAVDQMRRLQVVLAASGACSEAARLYARLAELAQRALAIRAVVVGVGGAGVSQSQQRPTSAQEREQLISSVRDHQRMLQACQNQLQLVDTTLAQRREQLAQCEQDVLEGQQSGDRHTKYRELRKRDDTMSAFLSTCTESMEAKRRAVAVHQARITFTIEQITMQGITLKQFSVAQQHAADFESDSGSGNDLNSVEAVVSEYKRQNVRLQQLQLLERRTARELHKSRQLDQQTRMRADLYGNVAALRAEMSAHTAELSAGLAELKKKHTLTLDVVAESRRRNEELRAKLNGLEQYRHIAQQEERLVEMTKENGAMRHALAEVRQAHSYEEMRRKVMGLMMG